MAQVKNTTSTYAAAGAPPSVLDAVSDDKSDSCESPDPYAGLINRPIKDFGRAEIHVPPDRIVVDDVLRTFSMGKSHDMHVDGPAGWVIASPPSEKCVLPTFTAGCACGSCGLGYKQWYPQPVRELLDHERHGLRSRLTEHRARGQSHGEQMRSAFNRLAAERHAEGVRQKQEKRAAAAAALAASGPAWRI